MRKNGTLTPVEINGAKIDYGGQAAFQFSVLELTERAKLEQQLRQAEKLSAIGQMISGVAHELNNPLSVVKGYLELVLAHHTLSPQTRADLEKAAHESNRAAKLVMNFLTFAREQPSHRGVVNLNDLVHRLVELHHFDLQIARAEVTLELDKGQPLISADADQIHQLLVNLVNNSLQAMVDLPRAGRLTIKTLLRDEHVELTVEDNGPGVPANLVDKIFEPFFTTKEVGAGTGLGLSLAHSIMTDHKGRIYYKESSLGGAAFVMEFPLARGAVTHTEDTTALVAGPAPAAPAQSGTILVLDDEKSIAEMLGEMLGLLGYTPTVCHAATQALECVERQDFDLVISDFRMPNFNGRQFYEMAVSRKPELARKIIFLTGDVVNEETRAFIDSIGNPHIAKPFNLDNVKAVVSEVIEAGRAEPATAGK
jgi:two-component system NtrC family sensor kinase